MPVLLAEDASPPAEAAGRVEIAVGLATAHELERLLP
jgi:hypothetical protein